MRLFNILVFALLAFSACEPADKSKTAPSEITGTKIELIDFYGTHRCVTCEAIEANTEYTVDTFFKKEVGEGLLVFKKIDVDDEANYDMAEKFEATGTALFINVIKEGAERHVDLTAFAFNKGKDRELFSQELKAKITEELKGL